MFARTIKMSEYHDSFGKALSKLGSSLLDFGAGLNKEREEAKSNINQYLIGAQIPEEVDRIYQRAAKNPDATAGLEEFQNSFIGLAKGVMAATPQGKEQLYAGRLLAHTAKSYEKLFNTAINEQNTNLAKSHIADAVDKYQDMADQAALGGDLNVALSHQASITKILFAGVKKGFITPVSAHTLQKQIKESITKNLYFGHGIKLAKAGDAKGLEKAAQDVLNDKTLSHASKTSLLSLMTKMKSAYELQLGVAEESIAELKKELVFQAKTNGKMPTAEQTIFLQSIKPKKAMEIKHAVTDGLEIHNAVQRQRGMPLTKKAEYLELLDKQIAASKSAREGEIYQEAKELVKKEINTLVDDPVSYVTQLGKDGGIEQELKKFQTTPDFQKLDSLGKEEALKQRKSTLMVQLQKQLGVEPRLLSNEKARAIVTDIKAASLIDFNSAITHLQKELASYGSHGSLILKDLEKANLPIGLKYTLNASPDYAPTMIKAFSSNTKDLETAARIADSDDNKRDNIKNAIRDEIKDYVDTLHFAKDLSHEAAELEQAMYVSVLQELANFPNHSLSKAVETAAKGIYGHHYHEIEDGIRIPKFDENKQKINPDDVKKAKENFSLDHFFDFQKTSDVYFNGWEAHDSEHNKQLVYDGRWVTAADDSGIFYITANGKRVYRKSTGKPYAIKFSELNRTGK
jgi:hypothetical protein